MTDEYLTQDIPWDDEEAIVDREPESSGDGRTHFGFLRLHALKVEKVFEAGHYLTIPNVTGGDYDDKDEKGLKKFKGWKAGGKQWLFVLVATKQDKDGNDYQVVKQMPSKLPRKGDPHLWADFTLPALKNLSNADRDKLSKVGAFCQWSEVGTGHKVEIEGSEREIRAWTNFKVFDNQAAMKTAKNAFWPERGNGGGVTGTFYPASWTKEESGVQSMLEAGKQMWEAGEYDGKEIKTHTQLANALSLFEEKTETGEACDVIRIISKVLDIPRPMVKL